MCWTRMLSAKTQFLLYLQRPENNHVFFTNSLPKLLPNTNYLLNKIRYLFLTLQGVFYEIFLFDFSWIYLGQLHA